MADQNIRPLLVNLSGPYAVGKDTILDWIIARYGDRVHRVRTLTTRPSTPEADPYYTTVTQEELGEKTAHGEWLVNFQIGGTVGYATSIDEIKLQGRTRLCVHSIYAGPDGAGSLRTKLGTSLISIGLLPTSGTLEEISSELNRRLLARGRDAPETIARRLQSQSDPIRYVLDNPVVSTPSGPMPVFDHIVINADLSQAQSNIDQIVQNAIEIRESL